MMQINRAVPTRLLKMAPKKGKAEEPAVVDEAQAEQKRLQERAYDAGVGGGLWICVIRAP